jgi:hypothetical protein
MPVANQYYVPNQARGESVPGQVVLRQFSWLTLISYVHHGSRRLPGIIHFPPSSSALGIRRFATFS